MEDRIETAVRLAVLQEHDVVLVRDAVRTMCRAVGLSLVDETRIVTAASELGRNLVTHAAGARAIEIDSVTDHERTGVRVISTDEGPGIPDLELALGDGYSTADTLGIGLPGARRIVDLFEIETAPECTRIEVVKWRR